MIGLRTCALGHAGAVDRESVLSEQAQTGRHVDDASSCDLECLKLPALQTG